MHPIMNSKVLLRTEGFITAGAWIASNTKVYLYMTGIVGTLTKHFLANLTDQGFILTIKGML